MQKWLRHNCSTQFRPATRIAFDNRNLGNRVSLPVRVAFCVKTLVFKIWKHAHISVPQNYLLLEARCFSRCSTSESCRLLLGPKCLRLSNNAVDTFMRSKSWCLCICSPRGITIAKVLLVYQETLCVVLYTVYFSSVMIPVKIKIIMK